MSKINDTPGLFEGSVAAVTLNSAVYNIDNIKKRCLNG